MATPPRKRATALAPQATPDASQPVAKSAAAKAAVPKSGLTKPGVTKPAVTKPAVTKTAPAKSAGEIAPAPSANSPAEKPSLSATKLNLRPATTKASPKSAAAVVAGPRALRQAKFSVGAVVKHRIYPFRGVVFDIDPVFNNTEDWWQAIPEEIRPRKDQPFYHLLAENAETTYVAYVSEQNLLADKTGQPVRHPQVKEMFALDAKGQYRARFLQSH